MERTNSHAVVIGGSISGLLAARVLSDHFERVTIVDRDPLASQDEGRRGVPQGRHIHALLARGADILEQLFPGFRDEMIAAGGLGAEMTRDWRFYPGGSLMKPFASDFWSLQATRPRLEGQVLKRVAALGNVTLRGGHEAVAPIGSSSRIAGIKVRSEENGEESDLAADLVVDATGRGSRSPRWLEGMGFPVPEMESVRVDVRYLTRLYRREPEHLDGSLGVLITGKPPVARFGGALAVEDDRWIVTLGEYFGQRVPEAPDEARDFAASLPAPDVFDVVANAEPCSEPVTASYPASQRMRYERLTAFPEGYLVIGDAICTFNPVYGQGMTVAGTESLVLDECLRGGLDRLAPRFFRQVAKVIDVPWSIAVGSDLRYDQVEGRRTFASRVLNRYMDRMTAVAEHDEEVARAFITVNNLYEPPSRLMQPGVFMRVMRGPKRAAAAVR